MTEAVRVRFAPSPSGSLHVGNVRTCLFNWLLARSSGGSFILRLEDTNDDHRRDDLARAIMDDLSWLCLDWDEGPDKGGPWGPYRQSERGGLYRTALETLRDKGLVYPCFCPRERLEAVKKMQRSHGEPPRYDNRCRDLPAGEAQRRMDEGEPFVWRFALPKDRELRFDDLVRGPQVFNPRNMGGDPVLVRSNGQVLFLLAGVVDDLAMGITHVVRGEDHVSNTAVQTALFEALGGQAPRFAHVPLVMGPDGRPLSKRHGDTSVAAYRQQGVLPGAMVHYLAGLGYCHEVLEEPAPDLLRLAETFDLSAVGTSPSVFDPLQLRSVNRRHLAALPPARLGELLEPVMAASPLAHTWDAQPASVRDTLVTHLSGEIALLSDFPGLCAPLLGPFDLDGEARAVLSDDRSRQVCATALNLLTSLGEEDYLREEDASGFVSRVSAASGAPRKMVFQSLRAAVTGRVHGIPMGPLLTVTPLTRLKERLTAAAGASMMK